MVILDIDMGYGLMKWDMTVSIRSSPISIWDILSLWSWNQPRVNAETTYMGSTRGHPAQRDKISSDIDMGDRYGISIWEIGHQ